MHVLFVSDKDAATRLSEDLRTRVRDLLEEKGHAVEMLELGSGDAAACLGCLVCFTKNQGCVNADRIAEINRRIGEFDLLCCCGPIVFGQYSATLKNVLDKAHTYKMLRSRFLIFIGYGKDVRDAELQTFRDIFRKHHGEANIVHPLFRERCEVFTSRSLADNDEVCAQLRRVV